MAPKSRGRPKGSANKSSAGKKVIVKKQSKSKKQAKKVVLKASVEELPHVETNEEEVELTEPEEEDLPAMNTVNPYARRTVAPSPLVTPDKRESRNTQESNEKETKESDEDEKSGSEEDEKTFYVVNKVDFCYMKYETKEEAMQFMKTTEKLDPTFYEKLILQDFESDVQINKYLESLKAISEKKPAARSTRGASKTQKIVAELQAAKPGPAPSNNKSKKKVDETKVIARPKLTFSSDVAKSSNGTANDASMKRFEDAMKHSNIKLDVWHLKLEGAKFDVWGFTLKDNNADYWSWKPNVLEKAIQKAGDINLFDKEGTTMDDMLDGIRAAYIRETPCGPNIVSAITLKSGSRMERMTLFGLIPNPSTAMDVKTAAVHFTNQCKVLKIQRAYFVAMEGTMKAASIIKDTQDGSGPLWEKLASSANNVVYHELESLNQVMLDEKIEEVIARAYDWEGGASPSMWPMKVQRFGFGETTSTE
jgi:hypothetical protein